MNRIELYFREQEEKRLEEKVRCMSQTTREEYLNRIATLYLKEVSGKALIKDIYFY